MRISEELQRQVKQSLLSDYAAHTAAGSHAVDEETKNVIEQIKTYYDLDRLLTRPEKIVHIGLESLITFYAHAQPFELFFVQHKQELGQLAPDQIENLSIRLKMFAKEVEEKASHAE